MPRVTRETTVRASPEAVFAALTTPEARAQWLTSMAESAPEGPLRVGTRIPAKRKSPGSKSTYEITVTALDAPRRIDTSVKRNGAHAAKGGYELEERGGSTLVRAYAEFELTGLQKMMTPMVSAGLEKELDRDLASLKGHVENAAAASASG